VEARRRDTWPVRVLAIVHQLDAGPGVFAEAIESLGADLDSWLLPETESPPGDPSGYDAVITLGGAMHADQEDRHPWLATEKALLGDLLEGGMPLLGVCLGGQLVAEAAGARPRRAARPEIGWSEVRLTAEGAEYPVLGPLAPGFDAFLWHSYEFPLPQGAVALAESDVCLQACRIGDSAWAIQFHAEVTEEIVAAWIDDYREDEDAVRIGVDERALRERTETEIGSWMELGRGLCARFLECARRNRG
jgi:GMP synthase (glutamine-hydrolysing)